MNKEKILEIIIAILIIIIIIALLMLILKKSYFFTKDRTTDITFNQNGEGDKTYYEEDVYTKATHLIVKMNYNDLESGPIEHLEIYTFDNDGKAIAHRVVKKLKVKRKLTPMN